jgi:hypothetical protein
VNIPNDNGLIGQRDTTVITATSQISPTLSAIVMDLTFVPRARIFLPVILR